MKNLDLEQNISGAIAPGREHSFAPWNICCNTSFNSKEVQNVKDSQGGRSMIEMLGVLAIIGVLSVGGIAGYSKAMTKYRINKAIEQITLIAGNIRTFFAPQGNYLGVECQIRRDGTCGSNGCDGFGGITSDGDPTTAANGCPIIKKAKILPDEMITVTDGKIMSVSNPFGGGIDLGSYKSCESCNYDFFHITFYNIPMEACIEIASYDWSVVNVISIQEERREIEKKVPLSVDDAVALCTKDNNDLVFWFAKH